jgi:hypothetical protein
MLNASCFVFLIAGRRAIIKRRELLHRQCMIAAFTASSIFLVSYVARYMLSGTHRYQGQGWGLKQVLLTMPGEYNDPLRAFGLAADEVLTRRVKNAPRDEFRWLKGWRIRVHNYQHLKVN